MATIRKTSGTAIITPTATIEANQTTAGDDLIIINTSTALGRSSINGGDGEDTLRLGGASGAQTFTLSTNVTNIEAIVIANTDSITGAALTSSANHNVNASAVLGDVSITGNNGNNTLTGGIGNNFIDGGLGNDTINGGAGLDTLIGGDGNDVFLIAKTSDTSFGEVIEGGSSLTGGVDQIRFTSTTAGESITLGNNVTGIESISIASATGSTAGTTALNVDASLLSGPITLTGNAGNNSLTATSSDDSVSGLAGNDVLSGGAGFDTLNGGTGRDSLFGGSGDDVYIYNSAAEFALGETITDIDGDYDSLQHNGTGVITLNAGVIGLEEIRIGTGTSSLFPTSNAGGVNASAVVVEDLDDRGLELRGNAGANALTGTSGRDTIFGGAGADNLNGGLGEDVFYADSADIINGGDSLTLVEGQFIDANYRNDVLYVDANYTKASNTGLVGIEEIYIAAEGNININLTGQTEGFEIYDNFDNNSITGGAGNDYIASYGGDDTLNGGAGNDFIFSGYGSDSINGGAGDDTIIVFDDQDSKIDGGLGLDTLNFYGSEFAAASDASLVGVENIFLAGWEFVELDLSNQTEAFNISAQNNWTNYEVYGGSGADQITTSYGSDEIAGGAGADTIIAGYGSDDIYINGIAEYAAGEVIDGGEDYDYIELNVTAADANKTIQLLNVSNIEQIYVTESTINFNIDASLVDISGNDFGYGLEIYANDGNNLITGTTGSDLVYGGGGNDTLIGGQDNGGYGDTVVFSGNLEDYSIIKNNDVYTVRGFGEVDTFIGFESVLFNGQRFAVDELVTLNAVVTPFAVINGANAINGTELADFISAGAGNDTINGLGGDDVIDAGTGNDVVNGGYGDDDFIDYDLSTDGADSITGGAGLDGLSNLTSTGATQIRLSFASGEVGNDNVNNATASTGGDYSGTAAGGLAVRIQAESSTGALVGSIGRTDDEGMAFNAGAGTTFDVRDFVTGAQRGDQFNIVQLGTSGQDILDETDSDENYYINGGAGDDIITGGYGDDFLVGGGGLDTLTGGEGDDSFIGGGGNDVMYGSAGEDLFTGATVLNAAYNLATDGADSIDGGADFDTVNVSSTGATQIRVSFVSGEVGNGSANNATASTAGDYMGAAAGGLAVRLQAEDAMGALAITGSIGRVDDEGVNFVAVTGTTFDVRDFVTGAMRGASFNEVTLGTIDADYIDESGPSTTNYYINAGMGNDFITTGAGNDFLVGGAGLDTLTGGAGNDSFIGGGGNDVMFGGEGDDLFTGAAVMNASYNLASDGADSIDGGAGLDYVNVSSTGATQIRVSFVSGEVGNNSAQNTTLSNMGDYSGTAAGGLAVRLQAEDSVTGALSMTGSVGRVDDEGVIFNAVSGTTFDVRDFANGAQRGELFNTVVLGTSLGETLDADTLGMLATDNYYINAGMGNDTVLGEAGNDFLVGGAGDDSLTGYGGSDSFIGGTGADMIFGGDGVDTVVAYNLATDGADAINLGAGVETLFDTVNVSSTGATQIRVSFVSAEVGNGLVDNATASTAGAYSGTVAGGLAVRLEAEVGLTDALSVTGATTPDGSIGRTDDEGITFVAASGTTFDVRDFANGAARGNLFNEVTLGTSGDDNIDESASLTTNYYINTGAGNDTIIGGGGNDFLVGNGGNDTLVGGAGNDSFIGGNGIDNITGGTGGDNFNLAEVAPSADTIIQNLGDGIATMGFMDAMMGGEGDVISLAAITDTVTGFTSGTDLFSLNFTSTLDNNYGTQVDDNGYAILRGSFANNMFTQSESGTDSLVVYDANSATGMVSEHSVLFIGTVLVSADVVALAAVGMA